MHFCSLSKSRKLHGVAHNGLSLESPEYGIVNYNEWIDSVSRYLFLYFHSSNSCSVQKTHSSRMNLNAFYCSLATCKNTNFFCITIPVLADSLTILEVERKPRFVHVCLLLAIVICRSSAIAFQPSIPLLSPSHPLRHCFMES